MPGYQQAVRSAVRSVVPTSNTTHFLVIPLITPASKPQYLSSLPYFKEDFLARLPKSREEIPKRVFISQNKFQLNLIRFNFLSTTKLVEDA
ncbi:hypothetical protein MMC28_011093, partial [Mycoblastus sanguinarius]|nr:hypothetical protein [Mycoblastus sanguinarius]